MYQAVSARLQGSSWLPSRQFSMNLYVASFGAGLDGRVHGARVFKDGLWKGWPQEGSDAARPGKKAWAVWDDLYGYGNSSAHPSSQGRLSQGFWWLLWRELPKLPGLPPTQHVFRVDHWTRLLQKTVTGIPSRAPLRCKSKYKTRVLLYGGYGLCSPPGWRLQRPWLRYGAPPKKHTLLLAVSWPARFLR